ncbi:unnamed protein product [Merluccius merluccius]
MGCSSSSKQVVDEEKRPTTKSVESNGNAVGRYITMTTRLHLLCFLPWQASLMMANGWTARESAARIPFHLSHPALFIPSDTPKGIRKPGHQNRPKPSRRSPN